MIYFREAEKYILSRLDLFIPQGVAVGVIGASGAGKTTLLKLVCGLLACEHGMVRTMGRDPVRDRKILSAHLRAYFSEFNYFQRDDTVKSQLILMEKLYRLDRKQCREELERLDARFQFSKFYHQKTGRLSTGQRRRVELAAVLMGSVELLLLDEPTNGLDEQGKRAFWEEISRKKEVGTTILLSSHNMTEIGQVCDRILLLNKGNVCYYGDREGLLCRYAPVNQIDIQFGGAIPDMEDLPLLRYSIEQDRLHLSYNTNHITAAEITKRILEQTRVIQIRVTQHDLADIVRLAAEADGHP